MKRTICPENKKYPVSCGMKYKRNPRLSQAKQKREMRDKRLLQSGKFTNYAEAEYYLN